MSPLIIMQQDETRVRGQKTQPIHLFNQPRPRTLLLIFRNLGMHGRKKRTICSSFLVAETFVQPVKTAQELESKKGVPRETEINGRTQPDSFKIPHAWIDEQEGIKFWSMVL